MTDYQIGLLVGIVLGIFLTIAFEIWVFCYVAGKWQQVAEEMD